MYPGESFNGSFFGFSEFPLIDLINSILNNFSDTYTYLTDFIFQAMFAATAATIVSGAIAERMKLSSFLVFSVFLVGLFYPITGMWKWGGGFLNTLSTPFMILLVQL